MPAARNCRTRSFLERGLSSFEPSFEPSLPRPPRDDLPSDDLSDERDFDFEPAEADDSEAPPDFSARFDPFVDEFDFAERLDFVEPFELRCIFVTRSFDAFALFESLPDGFGRFVLGIEPRSEDER